MPLTLANVGPGSRLGEGRMARARLGERAPPSLHRTLSTPGLYLWRMFVFLVLVGLLVAVLHTQLWAAMLNNPGLNMLICVVLIAGILYAFQQVLRLYPEIRWVNAFRIADPGLAISHRPVLLAPMATMLRDRTGALSLSATSMRSIMDSIGSRLDEARDTGRYLVGLLVFLGLLGTFWGLLDTIQSVGKTIGTLDTRAADSVTVFDELKNGLAAPLRGMGTAFSSSLLGLGGSLVLGFLELQAGHAHGRFYNQLEEWLSGITELAPGGSQSSRLRRPPAAGRRARHASCHLRAQRTADQYSAPGRGNAARGGGGQRTGQGRRSAGATNAGRAEGGAGMGRRAGGATIGGCLRAQRSCRQRLAKEVDPDAVWTRTSNDRVW